MTTRPRPAPPTRTGTTLVELMAVIAVGSVVLGLAAAGFGQLMRLDMRFADPRSPAGTQARLIESLRADAHASVRFEAEADDAATVWSFTAPGGRETRYTFTGDGRCERVVLVELAGVGLADGQTVFRTPAGARCAAEPAEARVGERVRLTLSTPATAARPAAEPPITIALGRDALLTQETAP